MANAKKSTTAKDTEVKTVVEEVVKEEPKKVVKPKHDPDELIACRSVTFWRASYHWSKDKASL